MAYSAPPPRTRRDQGLYALIDFIIDDAQKAVKRQVRAVRRRYYQRLNQIRSEQLHQLEYETEKEINTIVRRIRRNTIDECKAENGIPSTHHAWCQTRLSENDQVLLQMIESMVDESIDDSLEQIGEMRRCVSWYHHDY